MTKFNSAGSSARPGPSWRSHAGAPRGALFKQERDRGNAEATLRVHFSNLRRAPFHSSRICDYTSPSMFDKLRNRLSELGARQIKRAVILVVGATVLLIGVAMLVLPGPGLLVLLGGLAILGVEFEWARRWL